MPGLASNLETPRGTLMVRFYNKRGPAEQWIKEGKQTVKMTRSELPPIPVERGAAVAERDCIQPGKVSDSNSCGQEA